MIAFQRAAALTRLTRWSFRSFSTVESYSINDSFGKAVHIDASKVKKVNIFVETKWQESCNIQVLNGNYLAKMQLKSIAQLPLVDISSESEERVEISADIPEQHDLMVSGSDVQMQLINKVCIWCSIIDILLNLIAVSFLAIFLLSQSPAAL